MRTAPILALVLATGAFATLANLAAEAKPKIPSIRGEAKLRIEARSIPTLPKLKTPKLRALASLQLAAPASSPAGGQPTLGAALLAEDVVLFTFERLGSPQVGVTFGGSLSTWGVGWDRWLTVRPEDHFAFWPVAAWINDRSLLVECEGTFPEAYEVTYGRYSTTTPAAEDLGSVTVDLAGNDLLAFVIPPAALDGWERMFVRIEDANEQGIASTYGRCTLTRL